MQVVKWFLFVVAAMAATVVAVIIGIGFFLSPQDDLRPADVIVAISGGETQQRTRQAVELYEKGLAPKLLFSGAAQDKSGPSNAAAMKMAAIKAGVPEQNILIEERSVNTLENAAATAPIIKSLNADTVILVTSPYHQRRASTNFREILGPDVNIINYSSKDSSWRKNNWWQSEYTTSLTLSEVQKTIYVMTTKPEKRR